MTAERTILKCRHCSKEFKYASERRRHEQSHFPEFHCNVCSKNFSFISALRRHEKQHERTGTVQCTECSREFRDNILLKRHIKYAHGGTYTCIKCNNTFSSEPALSTHMKTHKLESERQYKCSFNGCTKKFNFPHHLKHHELTHTNTKQHYCKICNKGFIQSHHLKTHLKTHTDDSSLSCRFPGCNKKFSSEYAKKRHFAKHHNKTDSGISSDSNSTCDSSCVARDKSEDAITCSSCKCIMTKSQYEKHTLSCIQNLKVEFKTEDRPSENLENSELRNNVPVSPNDNIDSEVHNCKLVLGSCIMSEKGEKCVCAQLPKTIDEDYDFTPIDESINFNKLNIDVSNFCEGCECSSHCNIKLKFEDTMPDIEYKTDGTVKLKESFDMDIEIFENVKEENPNNDVKFVPYNSCKAIFGNCIVSGNGTIGDGCLCAKMILDEQVTAQEIDDITPHPKDELFCD